MKMSMLAIFAIVPVMGLVGVLAVIIMPVPVDAEAAACNNGRAFIH
jgi:hypothetical protein